MESSVEPQEGRGAAPETRRGDGGLPGMGGFRAPGLPGAGASGRERHSRRRSEQTLPVHSAGRWDTTE